MLVYSSLAQRDAFETFYTFKEQVYPNAIDEHINPLSPAHSATVQGSLGAHGLCALHTKRGFDPLRYFKSQNVWGT